ncbi:MAG TPA: helicase-related protein [Beijerinckiaceae bacterium]|nr:helicase-related protein [Beijerinckiaceae bacterium]
MNLPFQPSRALPRAERSRGVTAVLGPTNTGKTHYAIERMLAHSSGVIGLPLRLLAREVYNRAVEKVGADAVALITGEEKIKPKAPRYWVSTVEAMPRDLDVAFLALDEAQLAADLDRGHVFTDRLLNRRGREETLIIGASTLRPAIEHLLPGAAVVTRPRLSQLAYAGHRKISRLPRRTAIVAFSAEEVYAIAELIRRQSGGAAVVLGALSPRTRNAQVALYQAGEVDYIVATDAIGMGLNLDVDHVAFAADRKFDGWQYRRLTPAEFGQIAGRAGRNLRDGSFGATGRCPPFETEAATQIEDHAFDPVGLLQWRNADLDFTSIAALQTSLDAHPAEQRLTRAPIGEDLLVLEIAARDPEVQKQTKTRADVQRLWDVCQIPDYRKASPSAHADLVLTLFGFIVRARRVPDDWFARQLASLDRIDGDIEALSPRIAQVRTFNYIANRPDWLGDPEHWQGVTRQVEDNLSDALHERLANRFVDRRTSVLMRRLRENGMLEAEVTATGDVLVEGQHVGSLHGFCFAADPQAAGDAARTLNAAAQKALASEIDGRATRVSDAVDAAFVLANDGTIRWLGEAVGKIGAGDRLLSPSVRVLADEQLTGASLELVQKRLDLWIAQHVKKLLGPLNELEAGEGLEGLARGIAFQAAESLGVLERSRVANEMKTLSQEARAALRRLGLRFGAYHLYLPALLKPAPRSLAAQLWALKHGGLEITKGLDEVPHLASSGRTSFPADATIPRGLYLAAGFRVCGERAVRVDILERLADLIRPAIAYRPGATAGEPPAGAADGDGFVMTVGMTSLAGCSGEAFASILRSLGYTSESRPGPAITVALLPAAPRTPIQASGAPAAASPGAEAGDGLSDPVSAETRVEDADTATSEAREDEEPSAKAFTQDDGPEGDQAHSAEAEMAGAATEEAVVENAPADEPPAQEPPAQETPADETPADETPADETPADETPAEDASAEDSAALAEAPETPSEAGEPPSAEPHAVALEEKADATPTTVEIWRPQRHHHGGKRGQGERTRPASRQSRDKDRPASPAETSNEPRRREEQARRANRPPPRREQAAAQTPESKPGRPGGDDRARFNRRDQRGREDRAVTTASERPKRERPPDPDSPFAKLLALKEQLEAKSRKDG